jgi:hypothetical protein
MFWFCIAHHRLRPCTTVLLHTHRQSTYALFRILTSWAIARWNSGFLDGRDGFFKKGPGGLLHDFTMALIVAFQTVTVQRQHKLRTVNETY